MLELPPIFHQLQLPLIYANTIFGLGLKPGPFRVILTLPVLVILVSQSLYREWEGPWGNHYAMNCGVWSLVFVYLDWILLASPDKERWRKIQYNKGLKEKDEKSDDTVPQGFWERIWWGVRLATTNRYTGWTCQVKNVPMEVPSDYLRWLFIFRKSLRALLFYAMKDAIYSYTASSPHGSFFDIVDLKPAVPYTTYPFWHRFKFAWLQIILAYISLELYNCIYGIISVATGLANPRDCPSAFGDLREMWSVRNCWSLVWHQQCRRICSTPSTWLTRDVLHLQKGTFASKYTQLFLSFGISAIVHGGAAMLCHRSLDDAAAFSTFMAQAVAIMLEDHVIDFGKKIGLRGNIMWKLVGYLWTIMWFGISTQKYTDKLLSDGLWIHERVPDWFELGPKI